jgi:hypothetical protein
MPKFNVTLRGTLKFDREITVYAKNEDDAAEAAEEMLIDNLKENHPNDEMDVDEVYSEAYVESETEYKVLMRRNND